VQKGQFHAPCQQNKKANLFPGIFHRQPLLHVLALHPHHITGLDKIFSHILVVAVFPVRQGYTNQNQSRGKLLTTSACKGMP
jgi:hypothetical protein